MGTYSLTKAAAELGLHRNTVSAWVARGCPAVEKADRSSGREWQLKLSDIFKWRIETAVSDALASYHGEDGQISKDEADRRKAVAQARMAEVDLDERLRAVVLVSDATACSADFAMSLRGGLDNLAVRCAGRASQMDDPHEIRALIEGEVNRAMKEAKQLFNEKWAETLGREPSEPDDEPDDDPVDRDNGDDLDAE